MFNLLVDPLFRFRAAGGSTEAMSLPGVYEAMVADRVESFPALRPHQRHAWHSFLAQLAVLALVRAKQNDPPRLASEWRRLLRDLTPGSSEDEPWRLAVEDPSRAAFMQCPVPGSLSEYKKSVPTPDDLDVLVTSKNHDLKSSIGTEAEADDWVFSLVSLQTMGGYLGAGNHGIARMNGGYSSRPCLGLAPAGGGLGAHLVHDIRQMIGGRPGILDQYEQYYVSEGGVGLVWLEPWDGTTSLRLKDLDPHFIEICRRVRLVKRGQGLVALTATSEKRRVAAAEAKGDLGDHWTPVSIDEGAKALSITAAGFRYDRLAKLILDGSAFRHPRAMSMDRKAGGLWRLVARAVAAGQGKTEGYHERMDILLAPRVALSLLGGGEERETLEALASAQIVEVQEVVSALRFGVAVAASGGKEAEALARANWDRATPYARRLDAVADACFFEALQARFEANGESRSATRRGFARHLIKHGEALLREAIDAVPCPVIQRYRAADRARSAFHGRLRRPDSVFSDQPEIFESQREVPSHD
ncbi:MAG: CRISPR-associated protein Cse1 [Gemmatimonadota bacterium]|nr:CRISPR-associated protein Cse1 [Gemmatimonadota bacterium]